MRKCEFKIMCIVVMLYTVIFSGCTSEKANVSTNLFDVRNNGEYIQWKNGSGDSWHDLVKIDDLVGVN